MQSNFFESLFSRKNKTSSDSIKNNKSQFCPDKKLVFSLISTRVPRLKQLKYLSHFLSRKEKIIIKSLLTLVLISFIFLGLRFYFIYLKEVPQIGGEYKEGLVGQPQYINPILAPVNEIDMDISRLVFSGLLRIDKNQKFIPDLASNWKISKDKKIYTFSLKRTIKWHDGEPFTADDVIFTVETIQNPEFKSPLWISFQDIKIEKIDEYQIRFALKEPYAPFLSLLNFGILPQHLWQAVPPAQVNLTELNLKPIGTGPFRFLSLSKDKLGFIKSLSLERNEKYYNQKPFLKKITFKFFNSPEEAVQALKNKKIQGISYLPKELKEELNSAKHLKCHALFLPQYTAIFFNQKKAPFLKDKRTRLALTHSIDKEKIIKEALSREGEIIHGPLLPGSLGFNPKLRKYPFDPQRANELLEKAGWKGKKEREKFIRKKNGEILKITLTTIDREENKKVAEIIKESWTKIGVEVNLQIIDPSDIQKTIIKPRAYEALLYSIITGFDPDPYPFWHSSQIEDPGLNLTLFSSPEADQVLEEARMVIEEKVRHEKYQHFQNILIEEIPTIFLYNPVYIYLQDKKIKGFDLTRLSVPADRFVNIEEWFIKTKRKF